MAFAHEYCYLISDVRTIFGLNAVACISFRHALERFLVAMNGTYGFIFCLHFSRYRKLRNHVFFFFLCVTSLNCFYFYRNNQEIETGSRYIFVILKMKKKLLCKSEKTTQNTSFDILQGLDINADRSFMHDEGNIYVVVVSRDG